MTAASLDRLRHVACATVVLWFASGCGGSDAPPAEDRVEQSVGAAGGTLTHAAGASVTVGAGALPAATTLAIETAPSGSAPALPANVTSLGTIFAVTPHGQSFAMPVTVSVPFDASKVPAGARVSLFKTSNGVNGPWLEVPGATVNGGSVSAQVTSFSLVLAGLLPQIVGQPQSLTVTAGQSATFDVAAVGFNPPFTYQWRRSNDGGVNFTDLAGAIGPSLTIAAASALAAAGGGDNGAQFEVFVGSVRSSAATLTVNPLVPTTAALAVTVAGNGTVTTTPAGIACGGDCSESYPLNTVVTLVPTPGAGFVFSAWSGDADCSDGNVTMTAARNCTATFAAAAPPPAISLGRIAAGSDFSVARKANGDVVSWGSDAGGTLGAGNGDQTRNVPGFVAASNIAAVAAGAAHALATRGTGETRGWGYNGFGQLGDGSFTSREGPVGATVDAAGTMQFSDAVAVCGGELHSLVLRSGGTVHAMGYNEEGQLGDGANSAIGRTRSLPVPGITTATAIACRGRHSLALLADGTVRAWGGNSAGQLGDGTTANRNVPVTVAGLTNVIAIAAGNKHSLALRSDGSVWAWGSNSNGKLGDGTSVDRLVATQTLLVSGISAIAAGSENSLALRSADGVVLSWGINETGQLGNGSSTPGFRPQPAPVVSLSGVTAIAFGTGPFGHGLAVKSDGTVWAWGHNEFGQLGNGTSGISTFATSPVQVTGLNLN